MPAFTAADVARARADTPGCRPGLVHLNNAGASLPPRVVLDATIGHLELEARLGGYEAQAARQQALEDVYASVARLIGAAPDEIALVESATRAWDAAFYALPIGPGDRILASGAEYGSNLIAALQVARRAGAHVETIPDDDAGQLDVAALEAMVARGPERVRAILVTHVPTSGGLVNPAAAVGAVARRCGAWYLLDACQSVGQLPVDVEAIGCDLLAATGRKFLRGPRGTGFLYVRRARLAALEPPTLDNHAATLVGPDAYVVRDDARRFEAWESSVAGRLGLGAAVDYALLWGLEAIAARVGALAARLRDGLGALAGVEVHDLGRERCGIVTFTVAGRDPDAIKAALAAQGINVSVSCRPSSWQHLAPRGLDAVVRASVHYYNTEDELARLVDAVRAL